MTSLAIPFDSIRARIAAAARNAGRAPDSVRLIAVSKFHPAAAVAEAIACGQRVFGENRVQEAAQKFPSFQAQDPTIELHMIGALQTNKVVEAVTLFDVIQTLDRPSLAAALAKAIQKTGRTPRLYIEVNAGHEPQKAGIAPEDLPAFLTLCRETHGLLITGLMCIPPQDQPPAPYFQTMKALAQDLALPHLSMGMTADFETAIAQGATEVRIGTALFGWRGLA